MDNPRVRLGELLVRAGLITGRQLEEALAEQRRVGKRLGSLLVETGLVSETQVTQILSQQLSIPWVSLHHIDFSRELLDLVPVDAVERFCLVPIYVRRVRGLGDALYVAMDDPTNTQALVEVSERSGLHVRAMIAPPSDIRAAIHAYYGIGEPRPVAAPVENRRAVEDPETNVNTVVLSRSEVEANAAIAAQARARARETAQLEPAEKASASVKNGGSEDLRAIAPAKRPAAAREGVAVAVEVESQALPEPVAAPAPVAAVGAANDVPASVRATAQQGAERLRRAMGEARGDAGKQAARRMVALTLLDGTTIRLPAKGKGEAAAVESVAAAAPESNLTARDLVAALRAAAHGADATEVLGEDVKWERLFAALLSVLLKKHLISDWEFIEELTKG
jgi:type IV pilus assembly protein PilB